MIPLNVGNCFPVDMAYYPTTLQSSIHYPFYYIIFKSTRSKLFACLRFDIMNKSFALSGVRFAFRTRFHQIPCSSIRSVHHVGVTAWFASVFLLTWPLRSFPKTLNYTYVYWQMASFVKIGQRQRTVLKETVPAFLQTATMQFHKYLSVIKINGIKVSHKIKYNFISNMPLSVRPWPTGFQVTDKMQRREKQRWSISYKMRSFPNLFYSAWICINKKITWNGMKTEVVSLEKFMSASLFLILIKNNI